MRGRLPVSSVPDTRVRVHVRGTVQGVGFRPFIYRLARAEGLAGWVRNDSTGVVIEVEGPSECAERFLERLPREAPPVADIAAVSHETVEPAGDEDFRIVHSERRPDALAEIPPDLGLCEDCRRELLDPHDRRYLYPFINCTNCGPRFTIAESLPYDRPFTSMKPFTMCPDCQREYDDPADRRFHAQPNACWACGPRLTLLDASRTEVVADDPIGAVGEALRDGKIAAVKGLGGFHLACDATNEETVQTLRRRKWREKKPFALMVPDLEAARRLCQLTEAEERLLTSYRKPIVLSRKRAGHPLAHSVAPASQFFGLMLPYTPLHVLLLRQGFAALVMTSANRTDEPIAIDNDECLARLGTVADLFLVHDRAIIRRSDDSVTRVFRGEPVVQRRARGYVPTAIPVGVEGPVLALGGDLKNTICLIRKGRAYLSQHVGDLEHAEAHDFYDETIAHFKAILETAPRLIAHDLHPGYHSTAYARKLPRTDGTGKTPVPQSAQPRSTGFQPVELVGIQHHHAHAVACMAEHGLDGPVIGVSLDGTGYGTDGKVWGGEVLVATLDDFERVAHLAYVPMPGGEQAIKEPWRMTVAYLGEAVPELRTLPIDPDKLDAVVRLLDSGAAGPETSSMGRLFDGVSALLGVCTRASYEGQAAIELEAAAEPADAIYYPFNLDVTDLPWTVDPRDIVRAVLDDLRAGTPRGVIASRFHNTVVQLIRVLCGRTGQERGLETVVLSGGCFQNMLLLEGVCDRLERDGFDVRHHRLVP
ncbi:MAG: carbamoyltransferase HypF, partial [Planctomycetota bacterium]